MTNGLKYVLEQMLLLLVIAALACLFSYWTYDWL